MSGRQLAELVRKVRQLKVLSMTGYTDDADDAVVRHGKELAFLTVREVLYAARGA